MAILLVISILSCSLVLTANGQIMLGLGKWTVLNTQPCARDEEMSWHLRVHRHKVNRTHDGLDVDVLVKDQVDDSCAARLDICIMVDGGCKQYMIYKDDSMPHLVKTYAKGNVKVALDMAGIDPPDFPVPKGDYHVQNFLLDLEQLPQDGIYGEFGVDGYIVKGGVDVACVHVSVKYEAASDRFG